MRSSLELDRYIHWNLVPDVSAQIFKYCSLEDLKSLSSCSSSFNEQVAELMWKEVCIPAEVLNEKHFREVHATKLSKLVYTEVLRLADVSIFRGRKFKNFNCVLNHCDPNVVKTFIRQGEESVSPFVLTSTFKRLPNLERVTISGKTIAVAAFSGVTILKNIRSLDLSNTCANDETLQRICCSLYTLELLNLNATKVTGKSLLLLQRLPCLSILRLSQCEIRDVGASHIAACKHLSALDVSQCYLSNSGLEALAKLTDLTALEATQICSEQYWSTGYSDEGVYHLLRLKKLKSLAIGGGGCGQVALTFCSISMLGSDHDGLHHLTSLSIRFSRLNRHCLRSLSSLQYLVHLDILHCKGVDDGGIMYFPVLVRLQTLQVTGCFTNLALHHISQLSLLSSLTFHVDLGDSRVQPGVNEEGLAHLKALSHLQTLEIHAKLTSRGFEMIGGITSLQKLDVSLTALSDDAFVYLSRLPNLKSFICGGWRFDDPWTPEDLLDNPYQGEYLSPQNVDSPSEDDAADHWNQLPFHEEDLERVRDTEDLQLKLERMQRMPTNKCMYHIGNMASLEYLDISHAPVTNDSLPHLRRLQNLKELICYGTGLTPDGLKELNVKVAQPHYFF